MPEERLARGIGKVGFVLAQPEGPATLPPEMKHRFAALLFGLASLFGLSSCLEVEETITLKKDGSGTITKELVYSAQTIQMMEGFGGAGGGPNPLTALYDEDRYKKEAADHGEGVTYSKMEKVARNGGKGVKVIYTFDDINKVSFAPGSSMSELGKGMQMPGAPAAPADEVKTDPITFKYAGGQLTINMPEPQEGAAIPGAPPGDLPADNPQMEAMMMQMLADMKVAGRMVIDPGIAKTNASHVDGNTITFMEMKFNELAKNPGGLKALQKLQGQKPEQAKETMKNLKGIKVETEAPVNVTVK